MPKTTKEIYDMVLTAEENDVNLSGDEKLYSEEEYFKLKTELKAEWNKILNANINFHNTIITNLREDRKQLEARIKELEEAIDTFVVIYNQQSFNVTKLDKMVIKLSKVVGK